MRDFRKYDVWNDGIDFAVELYHQTNSFPSEEKFGLSSQLRRAVVSIPSNIAEGCSRSSEAEFGRFIEFSIGSSFEIETQLTIANRLNYLDSDKFCASLETVQSLAKRLNALRSKIKQ